MGAVAARRLAWSARRLAWSVVGADIALLAAAFVLEGGSAAQGEIVGLGFEHVGLAFAVVGAMIVSRQPRHRIGWLFCGAPSGVFLAVAASAYAARALVLTPGSLPIGPEVAWLGSFVWTPSASS